MSLRQTVLDVIASNPGIASSAIKVAVEAAGLHRASVSKTLFELTQKKHIVRRRRNKAFHYRLKGILPIEHSDQETGEFANSDPLPWSGEDLPPVGMVCVVKSPGYSNKRFDRFIGQEVEVIAHDKIGSDAVAVFKMEIGLDEYDYHSMIAGCFETVKTPEQIAAEERDTAIEQMILVDEKGSLSRTHFCGLLYDAGYRLIKEAP